MTDLVERLQPRWAFDEELSRAAAKRDTAMREIVTDYIVKSNALKSEAATALSEAKAENERLRERSDALQREAEQWKGEALAHKSSLHEAYQVLTGATGEPANWNGARPFRQFKEVDQQAFVEWLRAWVRMKFGKVITFNTAYGARMSFNAERSQMMRDTLAATSILNPKGGDNG